jgi:mRNA interferase MazF
MEKDFDTWNTLKQNLNAKDAQNKTFSRPIVVIRSFSREVFWGIPLTSKLKKSEYYYSFLFNGNTTTAILTQMRLFDVKRLTRKIGLINTNDYEMIRKKIINLLI